MLLSELSIPLPGKELAGSERKESIKPQVLHHQNDRGEKQKQQELLRPLGEMCPNDCHTSSVEPVGQKWKGRLSDLIALLPAPGFQAPTYQPYCVQPDTKWKEHSTRLQRAGARLHVEPPQLSLQTQPLVYAPVSSFSQRHPWMATQGLLGHLLIPEIAMVKRGRRGEYTDKRHDCRVCYKLSKI